MHVKMTEVPLNDNSDTQSGDDNVMLSPDLESQRAEIARLQFKPLQSRKFESLMEDGEEKKGHTEQAIQVYESTPDADNMSSISDYQIAVEKLQADLNRSLIDVSVEAEINRKLKNKVVQFSKGVLMGQNIVKEKEQEILHLNSELDEYKRKELEELCKVRAGSKDQTRHQLFHKESMGEIILQEKEQEVVRLNSELNECKSSAEEQKEEKEQMQKELEEMRKELGDSKEQKAPHITKALMGENIVQEKEKEIVRLNSELNDYKISTEKQKGENATLQKEKEQMQSELEEMRKEQTGSKEQKTHQAFTKANRNLKPEFDETANDMKDEAEAERQLQSELEGMVEKLREEEPQAMNILQSKLDQLTSEMAAAENKAKIAMQEKEQELQQLKAQLQEYSMLSLQKKEDEANKELQAEPNEGGFHNGGKSKDDQLMHSPSKEYSILDLSEKQLQSIREERERTERRIAELQQMISDKSTSVVKRYQYQRELDTLINKTRHMSAPSTSIEELTKGINDSTVCAEEKDQIQLQVLTLQVQTYKSLLQKKEEENKELQSELEQVKNEMAGETETNRRFKVALDRLMSKKDEAQRVKSELESSQDVDVAEKLNAVPEEGQLEQDNDKEAEDDDKHKELQSELDRLKDEISDYDETFKELKSVLKQLMSENDEAEQVKSELEMKVRRLTRLSQLASLELEGEI